MNDVKIKHYGSDAWVGEWVDIGFNDGTSLHCLNTGGSAIAVDDNTDISLNCVDSA